MTNEMATTSGNIKSNKRISMAEELMNIITCEEYVKLVSAFPSTAYLNKLEVSSMKKMISVKLWIDSRKFMSRQQSVVVNGLFALFGATLGRSASEIRADACEFFLDPDSKDLHDLLRVSVTQGSISYSNWIRCLSSDDYPCDEFGLFLLSYVYKCHVIVILWNTVWCAFVSDKMSTFEKLCKADHTLIWLGDDKYLEVKLLQVKGSNLAEWQQLAESIDHLLDKNKSNKKQWRVERATASVCTPKKRPDASNPILESTRSTRKRDSKVSIDYKRFHEVGTLEEKKRKLDKFLPMSSGPSATRLEAQKQILQTKEQSRKVVTQDYYRPWRTVVISKTSNPIKQEHATSYSSTRIVKPEPGIFMTHHHNPQDLTRNWKYVHVSGRLCRQGGGKDCNSQSENENETDNENNSLPDLPIMVNQPVSSKSANTQGNNEKDSMPIELISPPAIERHTEAPQPTLRTRTRNLGDLLCTLNFNQVPTNEPTSVPHKVVTLTQEESHIRPSPVRQKSASAIVTISSGNSSPAINSPVRLESPRKVVTPKPLPPNALNTNIEQTDSLDHIFTLHTPNCKTIDEPNDNQKGLLSDIQPSGTDSTPRSVITNPDATELDVLLSYCNLEIAQTVSMQITTIQKFYLLMQLL